MKTMAINSTILATALVTSLAFSAGLAQASDDDYCSRAPHSEWRTSDDAKAAAEAQGYQVSQVKVEDNCYEIYAREKGGRRMELYVDPVTLKIVKSKSKS